MPFQTGLHLKRNLSERLHLNSKASFPQVAAEEPCHPVKTQREKKLSLARLVCAFEHLKLAHQLQAIHAPRKEIEEDNDDPYVCSVNHPVPKGLSVFYFPKSHIQVGDTIPQFQCDALEADGSVAFTFSSDRPSGQFTVLAFFCAEEDWLACEPSMGTMEALWKRYQSTGCCQFLAISRNQMIWHLRAFRMGLGATFTIPMVPDPEGKIYSKFVNNGVPFFYLLDRSYRVVQVNYAQISNQFVATADHLLEQYQDRWKK